MEEKKNVNLTIDSRIISHLGEALIDDEKVALLELIKNSSDADALNCSITIDTLFESSYGKGKIVIEDDGNGMNPFIIENGFLKIATSFKKNNQKISPKFKRLAQGNKGIGRLALNQLGNYLEVRTKVNLEILENYYSTDELLLRFGNSNRSDLIHNNKNIYYSFSIDWNDYENFEGKVEDVPIELETNNFSSEVFSHRRSYGTRIEVFGLKGLEFWQNSKTINDLETDVLAFLNPYIDESSNFKVKIKLDNQIFRSDVYDKEYISQSCDSKFSFDFDEDTTELTMEVHRSKDYIRRQVDELISGLKKYDCDLISEIINYEDYFRQFAHEKIIINIATMDSIILQSPRSKMDEVYRIEEKSDESENVGKIYLPGNFSGVIYAYDFAPQATTSETKKMIQNITGVKLYRNNFRIFPYGNPNNDWLGMSDFNQRNKAVVYKTHTTTGFVNIDGERNLEILKELTNRQGLVLDKYGKNFLLIMQELIFKNAAFEDRKLSDYFTFVRNDVSKYPAEKEFEIANLKFKKRANHIETAKNTVVSLENKVEKFQQDVEIPSLFQDDELKITAENIKKDLEFLKDNIVNIDDEVENKEAQINDRYEDLNEFLPVMGATIISETLAHEIIRLSQNIKSYSSKIRSAISKDDKKTMLRNLSNIDSDIKFLSRYASLMDVNSYSKKRKFEVTSLSEAIISIVEDSPLMNYKNMSMSYEVSGDDFETNLVKDSFKIIVENFVINSTYWLSRMGINAPKLCFELNKDKNELVIYDNGLGIEKNIEGRIFEPFVTNKPDGDGRGMGLNIVENLLKEIGATIHLSSEKNVNNNKYKFVITFSEVGK
ncbi:ATP-binding protein [Listeria monocytogenes]